MKTLILAITLLVTACGDVTVTPQPSPTPEPDVTLIHDEGETLTWAHVEDDKIRAESLRQAILAVKSPTDKIYLGRGKFDLDCKNKGNISFPDVTVQGKGMNKVTHLFGDCFSDAQGSAVEVRNTNLMGLTAENQSWANYEDGRTLEIWPGILRTQDNVNILRDENNHVVFAEGPRGPFKPNLQQVEVISNDWAVYDWDTGSRGHHWTIKDSKVVSGRLGIALMCGGGKMPSADIINTEIRIDTRLSNSIGATSNRVFGGGFGIMVRGTSDNGAGDRVKIENVTITARCGETGHPQSYVPNCAAISDGYGFGSASSGWTNIEVINPNLKVDGNGSATAFDLLFKNQTVIDKLKVTGGTGSGPEGEITKSWVPNHN